MLTQREESLQIKLTQVFSHEMLTPLTPILGYSEYMLRLKTGTLPDPDTLRKMNMVVHRNALRLQHLLENYLLYAKLQMMLADSDQHDYGLWSLTSEFFPHKQIPEWAKMSAWKVQRQEDLSFEIPESRFVASAHSLQKIVDEVVGNALKFSEPGMPVRIACREEPQMWQLDISDRGRGMTPEQIDEIGAFRQFDRVQYEQQGVGLGLMIVLLLVRLQGGECQMTSTPGQGTTVSLMFPKSRQKEI